MIKIRIITTFAIFFMATRLVDAQIALTENYHFNYLAINPAFTGQRGYLGVNALLGNQFNGTIRPSQVSQNIIIDSPIGIENKKHNVGFQAFNARIANINNTGIDFTYSFRLPFETFQIAFGLDAGMIFQPNVIGNTGLGNLVSPFAGVGVVLSSEKYFLSLSKPQAVFSNDNQQFLTKKPFYAMLGGSFGESESVTLNTSVLTEINKTENGINSGNALHGNAKVWFGQRIGAGVSYRMEGQNGFSDLKSKAIFSLEYQYSTSMRFGLSYDKKPYNFIGNSTVNQQSSNGILLLMLKFEPNGNSASNASTTTSRFGYY